MHINLFDSTDDPRRSSYVGTLYKHPQSLPISHLRKTRADDRDREGGLDREGSLERGTCKH